MVRIFQQALIMVTTSFIFAGVLLAYPGDPTASPTGLSVSYPKFELQNEALKTALHAQGTHSESYLSFQQKRKSRGRAFLQSLLLPGWGQHYAGSGTMMKVFIASETILLGSFIWFRARSNWLEEDYKTFAASHAGIHLDGKNDRFFVDIGNYDNTSEYNQAQLRDRDLAALYPETPEFLWQWDSSENREEFEDIRIRSDRAQNRAEITLAFVLLNHLASAIHSTLAVFKFNKQLEKSGLGIEINYRPSPSGYLALQVGFHKRF